MITTTVARKDLKNFGELVRALSACDPERVWFFGIYVYVDDHIAG